MRAQLVRDEADDVRMGRTPVRATAKATFVVLGLQLEESQYVYLRFGALSKVLTDV